MKTNVDSMFSKYTEALNNLSEKLNDFNEECLVLGENNPIEHIKYRLKDEKSIKNKLRYKMNLDYTLENIENLTDVVGVRIVCSFKSDITKVVNYIKNNLGYEILDIRDYIKNPKDSGYSSYHLIVSVPVTVDGKTEFVKAEIQVRTTAMDVLSSQNHRILYKQDYDKDSEFYLNLLKELKDTRIFVNNFDDSIDKLYQKRLESTTKKEKIIDDSISVEEMEIFLKKYNLALDFLSEDFIKQIINEYYEEDKYCPIEHVKWRIKSVSKMKSKLIEKGYDVSLDNLETYINDIGAIKIVCSFLDETEEIINLINSYSGFKILEREDFITYPKESGYRSYHFVVGVPVEIDNERTYVKIEIQVRTIMMDFWANVEHKMCFKKDVRKDIKEEFIRMSNILWEKELRMNELARMSRDRKNNLRRKRTIIK